MECKFEKAVVIGTSALAFQCAKKLMIYGLPATFIEYEQSAASTLMYICKKGGVPFVRLGKNEITNHLLSINEDCLIVSVVNNYLFPPCIVAKTNLNIINFHNALLPQYAGRNAEAWVIFMQEKETGITWHYVNTAIDNGDIVRQKTIPISKDITSLKLLKEQHEAALSLFDEILPGILVGVKGKKQDPPNPRNMYYAKDIPGNGILDIHWDKDKIYAFLRAMDYGSLKMLGSPKVFIDGTFYTWSKYKINKEEHLTEKNRVILNADTLIIECPEASFILSNIVRT